MNIYRFAGDMSHLIGLFLLLRLAKKGQSAGVSLKAQELYLVVYCTRYLDLFTTFYSLYNSAMKVVYISITGLIVYMLRCSKQWHTSYNPEHDSFPHWKRIPIPSFVVALVVHLMGSGPRYWPVLELLWTFSICLEPVAMLPQLIMFRSEKAIKGNQGKDEILIPIFLFGIYRGFYILNWIYRAHNERNYRHRWLVYICSVIQVVLYSSFFNVCCKTTNVCSSKKTQAEQTEKELETPLMAIITDQGITSTVIGVNEEEDNLTDDEEDGSQQSEDIESNDQRE
jgi:ER lumen protein retaining receptor